MTTTTISDAQRTYVEKRVADAGLADRITVLGLDWRDLTGRFDKLVSVEMIEAVDWRWHDQFLAKCADLLTDDGLAAIQAIVIDDRSFERAKRHRDFVRRMVFPGGCLPSVASLTTSLARATDLRIVDLEDIGRHYTETLRRWADRLATHSDAVAALGVGREFRRLWDLYLAYCEASFLERHISDVQLVLAKSGRAGRLAARPACALAWTGGRQAHRAAASSSTARTKSSPRRPLKPSAPRRSAWSASAMAAPPSSTVVPGSAVRRWAMTRRAEAVDAWVVQAMATARRSGVSPNTWASASAGVSAPSSITLNPAQRSRSAAMATGAECRSAGGVVMTTLPRLGPRRANRAPMREMSRTATALARCSSATVSSPSVPAVSDGFEGRCH